MSMNQICVGDSVRIKHYFGTREKELAFLGKTGIVLDVNSGILQTHIVRLDDNDFLFLSDELEKI